MVSRTHREVHDGQELIFALLVFRRSEQVECEMSWMLPSVLFGEIACSVALFEKLVRQIGVPRPLPQEARLPSKYELTPQEQEDAKWADLLNDPDALKREPSCDDDIPF
ncbi:MAG: hypothetical protein ACR2JV_00020 [Gaiellales bacterium]